MEYDEIENMVREVANEAYQVGLKQGRSEAKAKDPEQKRKEAEKRMNDEIEKRIKKYVRN